jgi:hypothetical protein
MNFKEQYTHQTQYTLNTAICLLTLSVCFYFFPPVTSISFTLAMCGLFHFLLAILFISLNHFTKKG